MLTVPVSIRSASHRAPIRVIAGGRAGNQTERSDEALIEAVEQGDRLVAGELYGRLIGTVESVLCRMLGERVAEHDDLVQCAFEQILITLRRRQFTRACSLKGWAGAITTNIALNAIRDRVRERTFVDAAQPVGESCRQVAAAADVHREVAAREQLQLLRRHLAEMPPAKALPVVLHDVLGHDLAEISVLTGVSVAAAQSRLVRGRRDLRRRLEAESATEGEVS